MVFCPSRHPLLSSRARSKRLLGAALSSVRGQSNFPANHPQFLTLLRALETCGPFSFMYGSVSSSPSGAFVVNCLQLSLHFLYTQLQLAAELRSGLTCNLCMKQHTKTGRTVTVPGLDPRGTKCSTLAPGRSRDCSGGTHQKQRCVNS